MMNNHHTGASGRGFSAQVQTLVMTRAHIVGLMADDRVGPLGKQVGCLLWAITETWKRGERRRIPWAEIAEHITYPGEKHPSDRGVRAAVAELEEAGYLTVDRKGCGRGKPATTQMVRRVPGDPLLAAPAGSDWRVWVGADDAEQIPLEGMEGAEGALDPDGEGVTVDVVGAPEGLGETPKGASEAPPYDLKGTSEAPPLGVKGVPDPPPYDLKGAPEGHPLGLKGASDPHPLGLKGVDETPPFDAKGVSEEPPLGPKGTSEAPPLGLKGVSEMPPYQGDLSTSGLLQVDAPSFPRGLRRARLGLAASCGHVTEDAEVHHPSTHPEQRGEQAGRCTWNDLLTPDSLLAFVEASLQEEDHREMDTRKRREVTEGLTKLLQGPDGLLLPEVVLGLGYWIGDRRLAQANILDEVVISRLAGLTYDVQDLVAEAPVTVLGEGFRLGSQARQERTTPRR